MYGNAAHNIYSENNVAIESSEKLVELMYEGVLRFNTLAKKAMDAGNIEKKVYWINRSIAVIDELVAILNFEGGAVAHYLKGLYNYQITLLLDVNMHDDAKKLEECTNVFKELLEAWRDATHVA
ncbi:flagellar export chaperone FliS [Sulfurimonas marina]|uniref:Flagellar export chaperone FliS n=1 Tax=Sulfurimonas marina TaxID=2590551 RepID=A0A7M3V994_9BACT|nr:flagellar export chaperone FliS [Sulfurimonas marina]QOP40327.1 flagellar export chaperone FliS [Sulfurimonas marina]